MNNRITNNPKPVSLNKVKVNGGLLGIKHQLVLDEVIPYQWKALNDEIEDAEPSHALENFRIAAGLGEGEFQGMVFQDSDVAKWLEAVAYQLAAAPDDKLKKLADGVIDLIGKAQEDDGYLNTYFSLAEPDKKWTNLAECHELYCAGHMLEAAVAYFEATGEKKLLDIMVRFVDLIGTVFGPEQGKKKGYPGHQEIELALMRLYQITGNNKHLKLAEFFINERGALPHYFEQEWEERDKINHWPNFHDNGHKYNQAHLPVRNQKKAVGHSVRAVYMYCAMADLAMETGDTLLADACRTLWHNTTQKQMYITGGIGSSGFQEAFTFDYDMPNDTAYNETCASIGLMFWAQRMMRMDRDGRYADIMEQVLYNGILSGMSEDGHRFFYVNPLEVWPDSCLNRHDKEHVKPVRQKWFGCACCPPNIARLLASIGQYIYLAEPGSLWVNLFNESSVDYIREAGSVKVSQKTNYPWDGKINFRISTENEQTFSLKVRIPGWCSSWTLMVNGKPVSNPNVVNGYLILERAWNGNENVTLELDLTPRRIYSDTKLRANAGKTAIMKGPVVYCLEEKDNGEELPSLLVGKEESITETYQSELLEGVTVLTVNGYREKGEYDSLYSENRPVREPVKLKYIPYYAWNNRNAGEMQVWVREEI